MLTQPLFINTRPRHKALGNLPIATTDLPLLFIRHFDKLTEAQQADMREFIAGGIGVLVVVSVEAVRCAIRFLKAHGIDHATALPHRPCVVAVGKPTAIALRAFGFVVITPAEYGLPMSNEGMIQLPIFEGMGQGDKVLIWRGVGGRRLLADELTKKGVSVRAVAFYERGTPPKLSANFHQLMSRHGTCSPMFVLITSEMSLDAWRGACDEFIQSGGGFLPQNMIYLTLGERLSAKAQTHYPKSRVQCVANLDNDTLSQAIHLHLNCHQLHYPTKHP